MGAVQIEIGIATGIEPIDFDPDSDFDLDPF
jgi:hypothetical protein